MPETISAQARIEAPTTPSEAAVIASKVPTAPPRTTATIGPASSFGCTGATLPRGEGAPKGDGAAGKADLIGNQPKRERGGGTTRSVAARS